ncbi:cyclase dehydrase [Roseomonas sp. AR75]|uniref:cyclase dehydrase n=1 Tax=Roseomonas sp. AR75 TaxID=2562311 RepID=UPI00197D7297|nr:cyclase dehydrase [Roseomonas sp. AR75]
MTQHRHRGSAGRMAGHLGWFSIGLGLLEVAAARPLARGLGMRGQETLLRAFGLREILNGVGLLAATDRRPWMQGRIAGDALDMATLLAFLRSSRNPAGLALGLAAVGGVTLLDLLCAEALRSEEADREARQRATHAYAGRTGFPQGAQTARGAARDFEPPADFRIPGPLRPWQAA